MKDLQTIRKLENIHIPLWLLKDVSWVSDWKWLGTSMAVPTLVVGVYLCWKTRHDSEEFFHSLAVIFWILANTTWMFGEFFLEDRTRPAAKVFFFCGLLQLAAHYAWIWVRPWFTSAESR
jgi:hypothetical protein